MQIVNNGTNSNFTVFCLKLASFQSLFDVIAISLERHIFKSKFGVFLLTIPVLEPESSDRILKAWLLEYGSCEF
jgi:hypothetical protein